MCDADSCSMTPPHSPLPLQFEDFMEPSPPKLLRGPINGQDGNHGNYKYTQRLKNLIMFFLSIYHIIFSKSYFFFFQAYIGV